MKTRKLLSFILTLTMVLSLVPAFTVSVWADESQVYWVSCEGTDSNTENSLKRALKFATIVDIIRLNADIELSTTMTVESTQNITFDLNGHVLKAGATDQNKFPVINNKGTLTIKDSNPTATHTGEYSDLPNGGVITGGLGYKDGASYRGGGICNYYGTVTIKGGSIIGNAATQGGGIFSTAGTLIIEGGTITGNSADADGGGIYNSKTLTIIGGTITGNSAGNQGGGVYTNLELTVGGDAKISGNTKTGCSTKSNLFSGSRNTISISSSQSLTTGAVIGITMDAGTGAFVNTDTAANAAYFKADNTLANVEFDSDNNCLKLTHEPATLTVTNNNDSGDNSLREVLNNALDGDSIVFNLSDDKRTITLGSSLNINRNKLTIDGGAKGIILQGNGTSNEKLAKISGMSVPYSEIALKNLTFQNGLSSDGGAGLRVDNGKDIILTNCKFLDNENKGKPGSALFCGNSSVTINNCLFAGNEVTATNVNGTIYVSASSSDTSLTMNNCTITGNSVTGTGSAVYAQDKLAKTASYKYTIELNNCIVTDNTGGKELYAKKDNANSTLSTNNVLGTSGNWENVTDNGTIVYDNTKPLFKDASKGDYSIEKTSQAYDKGDSDKVPATLTTDLAGNARIAGSKVDVGCYEVYEPPVASLTHDGSSTNYPALKDASSAAADGDMIKLLLDVDDNITVAKNITLDLNGHVLDMDSNSSVITIGSGLSLSIIDSATGGNVKGSYGTYNDTDYAYYGGALHNSGVLTLTDLELRDSSLSIDDTCGGAIYNDNDGTININGSMKFSGNKAYEGGAIYNCGTINISGTTTFNGNIGTSDYGAIFNPGTVNLSGIIELKTDDDTVQNNGIFNWDISGVTAPKTTTVPSITGYEKLINEGTLKITVGENQPAGNYTIATGDVSNVTGKDTFTITGVTGQTDATITINGDTVEYNGNRYKLKKDNDKLVLSISPIAPHIHDGITFDVELGGVLNNASFAALFNGKTVVNAYLTDDLIRNEDWDPDYTIPAGCTLNLCLNGYSVKSVRNYVFDVHGTLNLYDCGTEESHFALNEWRADTSTTVQASGTEGVDYITIKGGYIANNRPGTAYSVGVNCYNTNGSSEGTFNMYGGNIIGCHHGAVDCDNGSFHMYAGTIQGNTADQGAGVNNAEAWLSFHMHGGQIKYNTAWDNGGGVYNETGDVTFDGNCYVWNNQIADKSTKAVIRKNNFETSTQASNVVEILGSGLASTSKIGVTLDEGSGFFATGAASNVPMFVSDVDIYGVRAASGKLELYLTADTDDGEITVPTADDQNNTTTKVVVSGDSDVEATGLDKIARELKSSNKTENVKIILTAKAQTEEQVGNATETDAIKDELEDDEKADFLVITLDSVVGTATPSAIHDTGANVVEVVIPYTLGDKTITGVFRYHGTSVQEFTLDNTKSGVVNTYYYENGMLHIFSTKFSTYAVSYTEPTPTPPGPTPTPTPTPVDSDPDYIITAPDTTNGKITVSKKYASYGDTIKITVTPDKGYTLETLTVKTSSGKEIDVTAVKIGSSYTFKMPSRNVTVTATFMEDNTMLNYFFDVTAKDYYYDAVLWAAENGITSGTDATHFSPKGITNRAQMVTFLWRCAGKPQATSKNNPFTDVKEGSYYYDAVLWGVENGVVMGTTTTTFSPSQEVTRGQAMAFIARFAGVKDSAAGYTHGFTDVKATSYYNNAISWAASNGITSGKTADTFGPKDNCERAHVVSFLYNYFNK